MLLLICFLLFIGPTYAYRLSDAENVKVQAECGLAKSSVTKRVIGGKAAILEKVPWTVLIKVYDKESKGTYQCGGSMISDRHVLTAAHCLYIEKSFCGAKSTPKTEHLDRVPVGTVTVSIGTVSSSGEGGETIQASELHPDIRWHNTGCYNGNDIAIITLRKPPRKSTFYGKICLPFPEEKLRFFLKVNGWGAHPDKEKHNGNILETMLKLMHQSKCTVAMPNANDIFCTEEVKRNVCEGDSGGSFYQLEKASRDKKAKRFEAVGLVSFGTDCKHVIAHGKGQGGVNTDLRKHLEWIYNITGLKPIKS